MLKHNLKRTFAGFLTATMILSSIAPAYATDVDSEPVVKKTTTSWVNVGTDENPDWEFHVYTSVDGGEATDDSVEVYRNETAPAGCVTDGKIVWTSSYDGSTKEAAIPAPGHVAGEPEVITEKGATCTEAGYKAVEVHCVTCRELMDSYTEPTDPALGHTPADPVIENEVAATCTEDGSYDEVVYCTDCETEISRETKTVEKLGHQFSASYEGQDATCTEPGYIYAKCDTCGEMVKEDIPAKGHTPDEPVKENEVAATCTEDGSYDEVVYCTVCEEEISREAKVEPALGHDYKVDGTLTEPTCTKEGFGTYVCTRCEDAKEDVIPAKGHTPGDAVEEVEARVEPTCEKEGSKVMVAPCTVCGEEAAREVISIEALGHDPAEKPVIEKEVAATCTAEGSYDEVIYCQRENCDAENRELSRETKTTSVIEHTPAEAVQENVVPATCSSKGSYDEVVYCSVCESELSRETKEIDIDPDNHDYQVVKTVEEPTCTKDGVGYYECALCGHKKSEEAQTIPALGHEEAEAVHENEVAATCTKDGSYEEVIYCTREDCDAENHEVSREEKTVPALGHSYEREGVSEVPEYISKEPTCTETGLGYYICTDCGAKSVDVEVPAKGHVPGEPVNENYSGSGNCHEAKQDLAQLLSLPGDDVVGSYDEVVYCKVCDAELSRETKEIKAQEHVFSPDAVKFYFDETDYLSGVAVFQCTNDVAGTQCNEKHRVMFTVDTETEEYKVEKEATCTEDGCAYYVASVTYAGVTATANTRSEKILPKLGHDIAVRIVESDKEGYYNIETYCKRCGEILEVKEYALSGINAEVTNVVEPTCTEEGSYDLVITDDSGLTKTVHKIISATGHTEGTAVKENVVAATCTTGGSYDEVVYCVICKEELSREHRETEANGHTPVEAVKENEKAATCTEDGSYDMVVNCDVCGDEISRETVTVEKLGHVAAEAVKENEKAATCTKDGSYDMVVYCTVCGDEISRETITVEKLGHKKAKAVKEKVVKATCTKNGSYDTVVYCSTCGKELSRKTTTIKKLGHTPAKAVYENIKEATATTNRTYNSVVYCKTCHKKISSKKITVPKASNTVKICICNNRTFNASTLRTRALSFNIHTYVNDTPKIVYKKGLGSKNISISSNGKLTIAKGTKKGVYKVNVLAVSSQTKLYKSAYTVKTITITVK